MAQIGRELFEGPHTQYLPQNRKKEVLLKLAAGVTQAYLCKRGWSSGAQSGERGA